MLSTKSSDLHHKILLIKQDDKFFTRLLSRELSMSRNSSKIGSFRGVPSSVPFVWESQPGTPKHRFHSADEYAEPLPPLTPPPSLFSTTAKSSKIKRQSSLNALFHKLSIIKKSSYSSTTTTTKQPLSSPTISSHSTSSSSTWPSSGSLSRNRRTRFGSWGGYSSSSSGKLDEEDGKFINGSPTSTLCFMIRKKQNKSMDLQKKKGLIHAHEITMF